MRNTATTADITITVTITTGDAAATVRFTILTLFPDVFASPLSSSIVGRALERGLAAIDIRDIRDHTHDRHRTADDYAYGGGPGMLMKPEPLFEAIEAVRESDIPPRVVLMSPLGRTFDQSLAAELASEAHVALVCGHYEGVDERVRQHAVDDEISLGDVVMTGGEPAAWAIVDAVVRLLPGVLGDPGSPETDSFADGLLQYPQYTRPEEFRGLEVPPVLLSGDHGRIARWRRNQSLRRTSELRPDLLDRAGITPEELARAEAELADEEASET